MTRTNINPFSTIKFLTISSLAKSAPDFVTKAIYKFPLELIEKSKLTILVIFLLTDESRLNQPTSSINSATLISSLFSS